MPSSVWAAHTGIAIIGGIAFLALFAGLLTPVVSALLLAAYRARIGRLMASRSGPEAERAQASPPHPVESVKRNGPGSPRAPAAATALPANAALGTAASAEGPRRAVNAGPRQLARRYAAAGAAYAILVGTAAYFAFSQIQVNYLRAAAHPLQAALLVSSVAWPIVLTAAFVAPGRRLRWILVCGYFAALAGIGAWLSSVPTELPVRLGEVTLPGWSGESPLRIAAKWCLFNAAPTLLIVLFRQRRIRAVAPVVLAFVTVVGAGLLAIATAAFSYSEQSACAIAAIAGATGVDMAAALALYFTALGIAACLAFATIGWVVVVWLRRLHERKRLSDQSLAVGAHWLVFAAFHAGLLAYGGAGWALAPLAGLAAFHWVFGLAAPRTVSATGPTLLVLRVFSPGRQSELLFDAVTAPWRHAGSVTLIAGTDLATATVAPRQFVAFVSGRLHRLFIQDRHDVQRAIEGNDRSRDRDGRFRINDYFCTADSWQLLLGRLVDRCDAVLMDLRRFTAANAGCIFEIQAILNAIPARRVVFVVDATTDHEALGRIVAATCASLPPHAANAGLTAAQLTTFRLERVGEREVQTLLQVLCEAAAPGAPATAPGIGAARSARLRSA